MSVSDSSSNGSQHGCLVHPEGGTIVLQNVVENGEKHSGELPMQGLRSFQDPGLEAALAGLDIAALGFMGASFYH